MIKLLRLPPNKGAAALIALILFQVVCTVFFVADVTSDMQSLGLASLTDQHLVPEFLASIGLVVGILFELQVLWQLLRREAQLTQSLRVAAGALAEVMNAHFDGWNLTASEADVAGFTIKGFSIAEIATMRGSAEGTVKSHLNAIYRKAGLTGKSQLVSLLIEDLLGGPLVQGAQP